MLSHCFDRTLYRLRISLGFRPIASRHFSRLKNPVKIRIRGVDTEGIGQSNRLFEVVKCSDFVRCGLSVTHI